MTVCKDNLLLEISSKDIMHDQKFKDVLAKKGFKFKKVLI
jgi:hypothetical protein